MKDAKIYFYLVIYFGWFFWPMALGVLPDFSLLCRGGHSHISNLSMKLSKTEDSLSGCMYMPIVYP